MNLETFKEKCKQEKIIFDSRMERYNKLIEEQKLYLTKCYSPKIKFNLLHLRKDYYCPNCKGILHKEVIDKHKHSFWRDVIIEDTILSCSECDYEFVMSIERNIYLRRVEYES